MSCVWISCLAAVAGLFATAVGAWLARGSTAVPAGVWGVAAWTALAAEMAMRASGGLEQPSAAAATRLFVTSLAVCPTLSLLGAKRPQHGPWQFIVATLAVVLSLPAASAALMRPGSLPAIHPIEAWLILVILLVGWINFIGTRRRLAATLLTIGLVILMRPFLPLGDTERRIASIISSPEVDAIGAVLAATGAVVAAMRGRAARWRRPSVAGHPLAAMIDPPFFAVRETLGAAWSLRIAERFDALAASRGWPCRLRFGGLETGSDAASGPWQRDAHRAFAAIMRRFVSAAWLSRHGPPSPTLAAPHARSPSSRDPDGQGS